MNEAPGRSCPRGRRLFKCPASTLSQTALRDEPDETSAPASSTLRTNSVGRQLQVREQARRAAANGASPEAAGGTAGDAFRRATPPPGTVEVTENTFKKEFSRTPETPSRTTTSAPPTSRAASTPRPPRSSSSSRRRSRRTSTRSPRSASPTRPRTSTTRPRTPSNRAQAQARTAPSCTSAWPKSTRSRADAADARAECARSSKARPNDPRTSFTGRGNMWRPRRTAEDPPQNAEGYALKGFALLKLKQPAEAASAFRQARQACSPKNADVYFQLGNAHDRLSQQQDAVAAFREAARLNPRGRGRPLQPRQHIRQAQPPEDAAAALPQS